MYGTIKKLYKVPFNKPVIVVVKAGVVGKAVAVILIKVPTPAVGAEPFTDVNVGVPVA